MSDSDRATADRATAQRSRAANRDRPADGLGHRLHIVTGKGGTGKTTVAASLALALAAGGRRVLLVEVEGRQGIAQLFGLSPLPYEERRLTTAADGGEVRALAVDAEEALLEYLELFYRLGKAGRALRRVGAVDFATTIAPGLRDVLLTGKVKESMTRTVNGQRVYDAVVLDAPPTGRIGRFLNVTAEAAKLAKVGPIRTHSEGVAAVLRSPMTAVHVVTLLEEMPVQETADAIAELNRLSLPVGTVVVNAAQPGLLRDVRVTQAEIRRGLAAAGLATDQRTVQGLVAQARAQQARLALEGSLRADLAGLAHPVVELPFLAGGVDVDGLRTLAASLGTLARPDGGLTVEDEPAVKDQTDADPMDGDQADGGAESAPTTGGTPEK